MPSEPLTYRVTAGTYTKVLKVVVGTPLRSAIIATDANIDEIIGVDTTGASNGAILVYNDSSGVWEATNNFTTEDSVIDGKVYPGNTDRQKILIRRSGTAGDPSILRTGELAYSWLEDTSTDGFGNGGDRLYIGTGLEIDSAGTIRASRIDTVGGRYFTNLLNHEHGILTASGAVIVDSAKRINEFYVTNLYADSAIFNHLSVANGDITTRFLTVLDSAYIQNLTVIDSATFAGIVVQELNVLDRSTLNTLNVLGTSTLYTTNIDGLLTVNLPGVFRDDLYVQGLTFLDSTTITYLNVDNLVATSSFSSAGTLSATSGTFTDSVVAGSFTTAGVVTGSTLTDGTLSINSGSISGVSATFSDSVAAATIVSSGSISGSSITDGTTTLSSGNISNAVNATFSGTVTADDGIFDSITTNILTVLDSAIIVGTLSVGSTLTASSLNVITTSTFNDSVQILANATVSGNIYVQSGTLYIDNTPLSEYIDSDVSQLLREGEAIDIVYSDDSDKITISAEIATFTNLGVASFGAYADSDQTLRQFSVTTGAVRIELIDGGFFAFDPAYV